MIKAVVSPNQSEEEQEVFDTSGPSIGPMFVLVGEKHRDRPMVLSPHGDGPRQPQESEIDRHHPHHEKVRHAIGQGECRGPVVEIHAATDRGGTDWVSLVHARRGRCPFWDERLLFQSAVLPPFWEGVAEDPTRTRVGDAGGNEGVHGGRRSVLAARGTFALRGRGWRNRVNKEWSVAVENGW